MRPFQSVSQGDFSFTRVSYRGSIYTATDVFANFEVQFEHLGKSGWHAKVYVNNKMIGDAILEEGDPGRRKDGGGFWDWYGQASNVEPGKKGADRKGPWRFYRGRLPVSSDRTME